MTRKKIVASVLAATISASSLAVVNAADKIDIDINKVVKDSKSFVFGDFFGPKYNLNDKALQDKLAGLLDSIKVDYYNSETRIKTYDFVIYVDGYEIGISEKTSGGDYYYMTISKKDGPHNFNTYRTRVNLYSEIMKIVNSSNHVSINLENPYKPGGLEKAGPIEMSVKISEASFGRNENVVLVGKDSIPDALCSASMAGHLYAPILLSDRDRLDEGLLAELTRLHAKNIYILSGEMVISKNVKDDLRAKGYKIYDFSGQDRYETSANIASFMRSDKSYILAGGDHYYDTPSISSYAFEKKLPILLTRKNTMPNVTYNVVDPGSSILAIGGDNTIASGVYGQLAKKNVRINRIAGKDRFDTSARIVNTLYPNAKSYICLSDKYLVKDIVTSVMSVKYQSPLVLEKTPYSFTENRENNLYLVFR
jgi:conserved domain protein|nr:cell wall-binding repeat-containing protein [uncultured Peptostreptococcus sp.]